MDNYGYVYKTTNLVNNKPYIGQHKGEFDRNYLGSGNLIKLAVKKYGRDNFAVILLGQALDKKSIDILEKYYIAFYRQLLGKDILYNITDGGEGATSVRSKESKIKYSVSKLGVRNPMFGKSGKDSPTYGRKHAIETKENQRLNMLGRKYIHNKFNTVKIIKENDLHHYLTDGWILGRGKFLSNTYRWVHNISLNKETRIKEGQYSKYIINGWLVGRLPGEFHTVGGYKWVNNEELKSFKQVNPELVEEYLTNGWSRGRGSNGAKRKSRIKKEC